MNHDDWAAGACTLPTAEQPLRLAEFTDLFATALRGLDRSAPTQLRLKLDADVHDWARDLAGRESTCCTCFTFTFTPTSDRKVWMNINVPDTHVDILDGLAGQAAQAAKDQEAGR